MPPFNFRLATPMILKNHNGQRYSFLSKNSDSPLVRRKSEIAPKFFSLLLILGLALSIAKVSTRSGCYTWDTSLVSWRYITTKPMSKTVKSDKILFKFLLFFLSFHQNYTNFNIEKLQWHFEVQSNHYVVYSRPIENIANFFAVCELEKFYVEKYKKGRLKI